MSAHLSWALGEPGTEERSNVLMACLTQKDVARPMRHLQLIDLSVDAGARLTLCSSEKNLLPRMSQWTACKVLTVRDWAVLALPLP